MTETMAFAVCTEFISLLLKTDYFLRQCILIMVSLPPLLAVSHHPSPILVHCLSVSHQKRTGFQGIITKHSRIKCSEVKQKTSHRHCTRLTKRRKRPPREDRVIYSRYPLTDLNYRNCFFNSVDGE